MAKNERRWFVIEQQRSAEIISSAEQTGSLRSKRGQQRLELTLWDTFSSDLHRNGTVLLSCQDTFVLISLKDLSIMASREVPLEQLPEHITEVHTGKQIFDQIRTSIGSRALLKLGHSSCELIEMVQRDAVEKIISRIRLFQFPGSGVLEVSPLRGYGKQTRVCFQKLCRQIPMLPADSTLLMRLLRSESGLPELLYTAAPSFTYDRNTPSFETLVMICRTFTGIMQLNTDGVMHDYDTEFLHDWRVAVRKIRTLLLIADPFFPQDALAFQRRQFKMLGDRSTPVRDADVLAADEDRYMQLVPSSRREDLRCFFSYEHTSREKAHEQLCALLGSEAYEQILSGWDLFLRSSAENGSTAIEFFCRAISEALTLVLRAGKEARKHCDDKHLHGLRKDCKRLRYLLACSRHMFEGREIGSILAALKQLQDILGEYHDMTVHTAQLKRFIKGLDKDDPEQKAVRRACRELVSALKRRKRHLAEEFSQGFRDFSSPGMMGIYDSLFIYDGKEGIV